MAQTGYTPILIYSSSTAAQAPSAGNLTNSTLGSELAINITDGKLFYKDNANAVQVIGWKIVPTTAGGTGLTSYTAGDLIYYASGTAFTKLGIGASGNYLSSSGTAPQWSAPAALTKTDDTNVTLTLGGSASTALLNAASLTLGWTGQLSVARGGTGNTTGAATAVTSNSTTGLMQITGPGAGTTRVMTIPNANFTAARTDAAQTFTGAQTFSNGVLANFGSGFTLDNAGSNLGQLFYSGGLVLNRVSGSSFFLQQNGSSEFLVTSAGNVQIGSSTGSTYRLFVYTSNNTDAALYVRQDGTADIAQFTGSGGALRLGVSRLGNIYSMAGTTTMTDGFFYIAGAAGAPTGVPTAYASRVPMYYDTTNNKFYVYNGAWKSVALT